MPLISTLPINDAVHVTVPALLNLSSEGKKLPLMPGQISARQSGDYLSPFKGRGMEFDESRPYQPGDDVRHLDWRVTARTGKAHSKMFREEQERPVFLWVDQRAPMQFATQGKFKSVIAAEIASLLAWSATHNRDRIGGIVFSDQVHHELKPKRGNSAVLRLINQLSLPQTNAEIATPEEARQTGLRAMLRLRRLAKPGSLIFLISDFRHFDEVAESQLIQLGKHSDVIIVLVYDPLESDLPPAGQYQVSNGQQDMLLNTYDRQRVENYREKFAAHQSRLRDISRQCRMPFLSCSTTDKPIEILQRGLGSKTKQVRR
jgi:uncharacterized protein (DUF58 family)